MRQIYFLLIIFFSTSLSVSAQPSVKEAPAGFDIIKADIPHGKIDTISYVSKTVDTTRRALIYTPPGYTKKKRGCLKTKETASFLLKKFLCFGESFLQYQLS